ncbi:hypothetical protein MP228_008137 [Amoeboaphelidium protococcarum]|nr:hypothetical protein MP228_008137 [Amoeboaphelidium protococcarum]
MSLKPVSQRKRLIVVLDNAPLEIVKVSQKSSRGNRSADTSSYHLLNCDDHASLLKKHSRQVAEMRPDITHQCLLTLMDSPLNKAGMLQVFIKTQKNVLIEINPQTRIPRTYKRFAGLMVQLLHKLSIRSAEGNGGEKLLKVIKNPVTDHLPVGCKKIVLSGDAPTVRLSNYIQSLMSQRSSSSVTGESDVLENNGLDSPANEESESVSKRSKVLRDEPVCFIVGAFAHGKDDFADGWCDEKLSISDYSLSASVACGKICNVFEDLWNVI